MGCAQRARMVLGAQQGRQEIVLAETLWLPRQKVARGRTHCLPEALRAGKSKRLSWQKATSVVR